MRNKKTLCTAAAGVTKSDPVNDGKQKLDDDDLRSALTALAAHDDWTATKEWDAIGRQLLSLAQRDSRSWRSRASEYEGAYLAGAVEFLRRHPESVMAADRPWGLLVARGRFSGRGAIGAEATRGLTGRDPVTHRVRRSDLPQVVSLDHIIDLVVDRTRPSSAW